MATAQVAPPPGFVLDEPTIPSPPEGFVLDSERPSGPQGPSASTQAFSGSLTNPFQPLQAPLDPYGSRVGREFETAPIATESPLRAAGRAVGAVGRYGGRVALGAAQDIGALIQGGPAAVGTPQTLVALAGGVPSGAPEALSAEGTTAVGEPPKPLTERAVTGAIRGFGEMAPALAGAAITGGATLPAWFAGQMGLTTFGETGDPLLASRQAAVGALLGQFGKYGSEVGEALGLKAAAKLPAALENATVEAGKLAGQQAALNWLMTAGSLPELQQEPDKIVDRLAEQVGVNLAFSAPHLPAQARQAFARDWADTFVRSPEYKRFIDEAVRLSLDPSWSAQFTALNEPQRRVALLAPLTTAEIRKGVEESAQQAVQRLAAVQPQPAMVPGTEAPKAPETPAVAAEPARPKASEPSEILYPMDTLNFRGGEPVRWSEVTRVTKVTNELGKEVYQIQYEQNGQKYVGFSDNSAWEAHDSFNKSTPPTQNAPPAPQPSAAGVGEAPAKQPWEMSQREYTASQWGAGAAGGPKFAKRKMLRLAEEHHDLVEDAVKAGKDVPDSVLNQYPDLQEISPKGAIEAPPIPEQPVKAGEGAAAPSPEAKPLTKAQQAALGSASKAADIVIELGEQYSSATFPRRLKGKAEGAMMRMRAAAEKLGIEVPKPGTWFLPQENAAAARQLKKQLDALRQPAEAPTTPTTPVTATPEPAISFPGIGSLLEGRATAMELGKIRKNEPELWKAITQHFGADTPAKIAKLAKARFEEMAKRPDQPQGPKWTTATDEPPLGTALYGPFGIPSPTATAKAVVDLAKAAAPKVKEAYEAVKEIGQEALHADKMTDYRRSVLNWSAKLQRSFGESAAAQKEIRQKVPDAVRREGITNWIQAGGDASLLAQRAAASTNPKLKAGYEAALNLTPEELAVARDVKAAYDALGVRGQTYGVLNNFRDNYVTQIWNLKKGPAIGSSRTLKDQFRYSKARTFDSFFEGEQAGYSPKTKDIAKLLPLYMHEMNSVIAARQLVEQMSKGEWDGEPLVSIRGAAIPVDGPQGQATLVIPKLPRGDTGNYKTLENQPALSDWVWSGEDSSGNPIFVKADLALHPEAYKRLKNVLGRSAIREWYDTRTSAVAQVPKAIVKAIDVGQSETKRTMLGFFAPFHQVQEATHAVGHRVNPLFNIPKIDLVGNAAQMDAARHGLMLLPDRVSESQFMEGFRTSGLVSKIPGIGPLADWYSNYLFKEYIPGLKYKTYESILQRNTRVYEKELASGEMKPEDVKVLSAEQANAAYGHLNYADLARNPTLQHIAQIGLLAPDFLEARGRFAAQAAKGAVGTKVGREQVIALVTLALAQATTAWIAAQATGGEWDARHPFEFSKGSRRYTMRSVPEDIDRLIHDTRSFVYNRLSPVVGKGAVQGLSGVDYAGRKVTPGQTAKEIAASPLPLTLRGVPAIQKLTGMDRPGQIAPLEQLAGAMGLKISRNYPRQKLDDLHNEFLENHEDPKVRADYERHLTETVPVSKYKAVYSALSDRNGEALQKAVDALEAEGETLKNIKRRLNPHTVEGRTKSLFHERRELEKEFRDSLNVEQYKMYEDALDERQAQWDFFRRYF